MAQNMRKYALSTLRLLHSPTETGAENNRQLSLEIPRGLSSQEPKYLKRNEAALEFQKDCGGMGSNKKPYLEGEGKHGYWFQHNCYYH